MAENKTDPNQPVLTVTQNALNVIAGNPGLTFSAADIRAINAGTLVLHPNHVGGRCITHMRFQNSDDDLVMVTFDDGSSVTNTEATNLNEFRLQFQEAACCGYGVSFCIDKVDKRMLMLNVYPCKCQCKDRN